jgi:hypothetical protein
METGFGGIMLLTLKDASTLSRSMNKFKVASKGHR